MAHSYLPTLETHVDRRAPPMPLIPEPSAGSVSLAARILLWLYGRRAGVVVRASGSIPTYGNPPQPDFNDPCIDIVATNLGKTPVTIASVRLAIRGTTDSAFPMEWLVQSPGPLPFYLEQGRHWQGLTRLIPLQQNLVQQYGVREWWEVRPMVRDTAGREYKARLSDTRWRSRLSSRRGWVKWQASVVDRARTGG